VWPLRSSTGAGCWMLCKSICVYKKYIYYGGIRVRHLWSVAYLVVLVLLKIIKNQYLNYAMKPIRKLKEEAKSGIKAIRNIYI